jgi:hypothetical protein
VPYHGHGHQEDPYVGYEVGDVGEVGEGHHGQTFPRDIRVPVCGQRAAGEEQRDGYTDAPCDDKDHGRDDGSTEDGVDEDAVVEGEDAEFYEDEGEVVEVAEDVVAFAHHHLVIRGDDDDMFAHAMGRACCCQPLRRVEYAMCDSYRNPGHSRIVR